MLEIQAVSLKYASNLKQRMLRKTKELNELIEQKANSIEQEDIEIVEVLKREVQEIEDERDMALARKQFAKIQLEGEKPSKICVT